MTIYLPNIEGMPLIIPIIILVFLLNCRLISLRDILIYGIKNKRECQQVPVCARFEIL